VTAITLNLLAEEQLAEQANARDPVKTTIAIGTTLLMLAVLCGSLLWVAAGQKATQANLLQARRDGLVAAQTTSTGADFRSIKSCADDLVALNRSRALFASQLALIKNLVPDTIQLNHINLALNIEVLEAAGAADPTDSADKTASDTESGSDKKKAPRVAKPKNVQHLSLQLDGRAVSSRPELEVDKFLQTLRADPDFSAQVERIQLRSIARSPTTADSAGGNVPSASFVIDCQYRDQK
jgi:hypothetical protein